MELYCRLVQIFDQQVMDDFALEHKNQGIFDLPGDGSLISGKGYLEINHFYHWYKIVSMLDQEEKLKKGQVGCSCYLVFRKSDDFLIGIFDIRHSLNYKDGNILGHIGVDIRPSERRKGYYSDILKLAVEECKNFSINPIIISCAYDNLFSMKGIHRVFGDYKEMIPLDGTYFYVYEKYLDRE